MNSLRPEPGNGGEAVNASPGCEINLKSNGYYELKISGRFSPDWIVNLTTGISRNRISIISGNARKVNNIWQAVFLLEKILSATDPKKVDYLAIARENPDRSMQAAISIDKYILDDDPKHNDGALYLEVKAKDQLGFLGGLLNFLSFYSLFPESVVIETVKGMISDRFWIRGVGGSAPSPAVVIILRRKLDEFMR